MEIQQLYYYMELCRQKNFTEAGYVCNMTQGALSKQIRKLEGELGVTLIRRNTRHFELSREGEVLLEYAGRMAALYEEMLQKVQKNREIKIGCMPVLAPYHLARTLNEFHERHPEIQLVLEEKRAQEILESADSYDFMILRESMGSIDAKYRRIPLYDDRLCAVLYDDHPLAQKESIALKKLSEDSFVFPEKGSKSYEIFFQSCEKAGFSPNVAYEFPQANTIMSFVSEGIGVTITFEKVYEDAKCQGIRMVPLNDEFHYPVSLMYRKNRPLDYAQRLFLEDMRNRAVLGK